jgi:Ca2+-binding EF-hand superfamily protein
MTKKNMTGLVVGLAVASSAALALAQDGAVEGRRGHRHGGQMKAHLLEKYDANKNGVLDPEEKEAAKADREKFRAERKQRMLERFDANHDGVLDEAEKAEARKAFGARREEHRREMLKKYDKDGDGTLSPSEREELRKEMREQHGHEKDSR